MGKRKIITIDEDRCTGCGECVPDCPEGALQVIDGKARLVSDLFCDGLGACVGTCPTGALSVEEREAEPYDESKVMANIVKAGPATIRAHLKHLKEHGADDYHREAVAFLVARGIEVPAEPEAPGPLPCGCPGTRVVDMREDECIPGEAEGGAARRPSRLRQWPVQIRLVPPTAPFLRGADLVLAADCVPFAFPDFHEEFLKGGEALLVGCPKLDDAAHYEDKLAAIFTESRPRSVTMARMEVPCCGGLVRIARAAVDRSGVDVPLREVTVGIRGEVLESSAVPA